MMRKKSRKREQEVGGEGGTKEEEIKEKKVTRVNFAPLAWLS